MYLVNECQEGLNRKFVELCLICCTCVGIGRMIYIIMKLRHCVLARCYYLVHISILYSQGLYFLSLLSVALE